MTDEDARAEFDVARQAGLKARHQAKLARSVTGERTRRIRITLAGESFIVDVWKGRIVGVTGQNGGYLGQDESVVARQLREAGASFEDLGFSL